MGAAKGGRFIPRVNGVVHGSSSWGKRWFLYGRREGWAILRESNREDGADHTEVIMTPVSGSVRHPYPQSVDDLARAQVILEALCTSRAKLEGEHGCREDGARLEELGYHPLAPAIGVINGLKVSAVLWGVILLGVALIW